MDASLLATVWFALIALLLAGYAVLDGFDLGVGVLHLFARDESERRRHVAAIAPVWDGNEVWLLAGGGALFAAFPVVYAKVFSAFYLALMLLLLALILRAVSLEFRGAVDHPRWRRAWDLGFGIGSLVPALLYGVAVGNVLRGLPIEADRRVAVPFLSLLGPYALLVGVTGLAFFVAHGALWLRLKAEGELAARAARWAGRAWLAFALLWVAATVATWFAAPALLRAAAASPAAIAAGALLVAALVAVPLANRRGAAGLAFLASSTAIVALVAAAAASAYPVIVPSRIDPAYSLTAANASASPKSLGTMLIIALAGMPAVIGYTAFIYRSFRGPVRSEDGYPAEGAGLDRPGVG
jgi:cytochrome d ubiquinol oxidase subunit II